jgi:hypothetical protein
MIGKKELNQITQEMFGQDYGRISKKDYVLTIAKMTNTLRQYQSVLYTRDLLYNPCHESERLNKAENNTQ